MEEAKQSQRKAGREGGFGSAPAATEEMSTGLLAPAGRGPALPANPSPAHRGSKPLRPGIQASVLLITMGRFRIKFAFGRIQGARWPEAVKTSDKKNCIRFA